MYARPVRPSQYIASWLELTPLMQLLRAGTRALIPSDTGCRWIQPYTKVHQYSVFFCTPCFLTQIVSTNTPDLREYLVATIHVTFYVP